MYDDRKFAFGVGLIAFGVLGFLVILGMFIFSLWNGDERWAYTGIMLFPVPAAATIGGIAAVNPF